MHNIKKYIHTYYYLAVITIVTIITNGCKKAETADKVLDDAVAKKELQGTWKNDIEGSIVFCIKGDSIIYNDSISAPTYFRIHEDTLFIENHNVVKYPIAKRTPNALSFYNTNGELIELVKTDETMDHVAKSHNDVDINQGKVIKKDTVMTFGSKKYHAYKQVNPTTYKVYIQSKNEDGLAIENIYYDNIVHIALYDGANKVFGQNIGKDAFSRLIPQSYLNQAILSDITFDKANEKGVTFVALLSIPYSTMQYRVNINIAPTGKMNLSL